MDDVKECKDIFLVSCATLNAVFDDCIQVCVCSGKCPSFTDDWPNRSNPSFVFNGNQIQTCGANNLGMQVVIHNDGSASLDDQTYTKYDGSLLWCNGWWNGWCLCPRYCSRCGSCRSSLCSLTLMLFFKR